MSYQRKKCIHAKQRRKRGPYPNPMKPRIDYQCSEADRVRAEMRHAWYRKGLEDGIDQAR